MSDESHKTPQIVIEPKKGWQVIDIKELIDYKDLFSLMIKRDITVQYKQTILGFAWAILNPLMMMVVFTVIFGKLMHVNTGNNEIPYAVFSFAALVPWTYFSTSLAASTNSLIAQANILTKVYFPRLIIPLTPVFAKLADFAIAFIILLILMASYGLYPTWQIVYLPVMIILMIMTSAGIGMWLSALAIQYRDIKFAITFLVQILMYAAPVVWSSTQIPDKYRLIYGIYPMAGVIEGFRSCLIGKSPMPWDFIMVGAITSFIIFISGAFYFKRMEKIFADVA